MIPPEEFLSNFLPDDRFRFILQMEMNRGIRDDHYVSIILVKNEGLDQHRHLLLASDMLYKKGLRASDHRGILRDGMVGLILPTVDADDIVNVISRISPKLCEHVVCYHRVPCISQLKIGGACFPVDGTTVDELLGAAARNLREL
jgi:hypothetical protein